MDQQRFSERHGFSASAAEITIRQDAPHELRGVIVDLAYDSELTPHPLRRIVCRVPQTRPDENNWSAFPNVNRELRDLLSDGARQTVAEMSEADKNAQSHRARAARALLARLAGGAATDPGGAGRP
jgi:hypothetical protein